MKIQPMIHPVLRKATIGSDCLARKLNPLFLSKIVPEFSEPLVGFESISGGWTNPPPGDSDLTRKKSGFVDPNWCRLMSIHRTTTSTDLLWYHIRLPLPSNRKDPKSQPLACDNVPLRASPKSVKNPKWSGGSNQDLAELSQGTWNRDHRCPWSLTNLYLRPLCLIKLTDQKDACDWLSPQIWPWVKIPVIPQ